LRGENPKDTRVCRTSSFPNNQKSDCLRQGVCLICLRAIKNPARGTKNNPNPKYGSGGKLRSRGKAPGGRSKEERQDKKNKEE
jgi:hypothetical protein